MEGGIVILVLCGLGMLKDTLQAPMKRKICKYYVRWQQGVLDCILAGDHNKADRRRSRREYWRKWMDRYEIH